MSLGKIAKKIGRWGAARLQGTEGVQKYDRWTQQNMPWLDQVSGRVSYQPNSGLNFQPTYNPTSMSTSQRDPRQSTPYGAYPTYPTSTNPFGSPFGGNAPYGGGYPQQQQGGFLGGSGFDWASLLMQAAGAGLTAYGNAQMSEAQRKQQQLQFEATQKWLREQFAGQQQLQREQMGLNDRQFGANFNQNENQFGASFGQRENQFGANFDKDERQFGARFGADERQRAFQSSFDLARYGDDRANMAIGVQRALNFAPMSDQASYMLQQRMGIAPGAFQARDYTTGAMAGSGAAQGGMGGVLGAQAAAAKNYRPGMGGYDTRALTDALARFRDPRTLPSAYQAQSYTPGTYKPTSYTPSSYTPMPAPNAPQKPKDEDDDEDGLLDIGTPVKDFRPIW
jgi:hypothetical protein